MLSTETARTDAGAGLQPGDRAFDPKTGKERTLVRRAAVGIFAGASIWSVEDCIAASGSPVPWDTSRRWPWVVHVDVVVPCRDDGAPLKVTFAMPSAGPPGSAEWAAAELAGIRRMGLHEAMESFGHDPHALGDTAECPALDQECTGIAATWCPVCGDCTCLKYADGERDEYDNASCPLHAPSSAHAGESSHG